MVSRDEALPGRPTPVAGPPARHLVLDTPPGGPLPAGTQVLYLAAGCFWGVERIYWRLPGVVSTAVGYLGGFTPNPTYEETCTGRTGHTEAVLVAYDPAAVDAETLLKTFWENHDPTTANRQGNDVGTQYRSGIYWTTDEQRRAAEATRDAFGEVLASHGHGPISTEIRPYDATADDDGAGPFYFAEGYHQQYLHTNPNGYCNHGPNGLSCPTGLLSKDGVPAQVDVEPPTRA
ncbi:peptide-methionine (S)-S-oxide reductase MsrA [Agilicoccus flavus]|uniref:peptide-methionine (S)-S-oxide reductase MsrA n=1 Tax=Agilicoccus flavus TaxID=2775968 RepID=UPI001CF6AEDE|nr:peptide-methionine (S)-S-oxide reductase MsrA [Agilicoccus flavus]